ncbi:MAG: hypothetical protein CUN52_12615, partial [Phototrophicales bacterium]
MFKYIRNRLINALMSRLMLSLKPIQDDISSLKANQELNQIQIIQMLQAMSEYIHPALLNQFSNMGLGKAQHMGEVVISPNYAKQLHPDDVFLVSYPRSGNTWMRTIIAYILYSADILTTLKDLEVYVPDLHYDLPHHDRYSQPRVLKTHEPYFNRQGATNRQLYNKWIYVIRHPYKTLTSYYDFEAFHHPDGFMPISDFVQQVLNNAYQFGGWAEHVQSWRQAATSAQALFVRYEDLQRAPIVHIQRIAQFLGRIIDDTQAEQVRQLSSQESMRELENKDPHLVGYEIIRSGDERKTKQTLDDALKQQIYRYCKEQMDDFGYLPDGTTVN